MANKKTDRVGGWIQTLTGKSFYPLDPRPEDIDIYDIIHSLSLQCRFAGHCTSFYSVAQHSVLVSLVCKPEDALFGLIHDASEAFLVDIPRPLKQMQAFAEYRKIEKNLMNVICGVFKLPPEEPESVKWADMKMLATEARDLTVTEGRGWATQVEPYEFHIEPWSPEIARIKFTSRFHELTFGKKS
jgi:hypothetical protein